MEMLQMQHPELADKPPAPPKQTLPNGRAAAAVPAPAPARAAWDALLALRVVPYA
jgi:hypothetical protein